MHFHFTIHLSERNSHCNLWRGCTGKLTAFAKYINEPLDCFDPPITPAIVLCEPHYIRQADWWRSEVEKDIPAVPRLLSGMEKALPHLI